MKKFFEFIKKNVGLIICIAIIIGITAGAVVLCGVFNTIMSLLVIVGLGGLCLIWAACAGDKRLLGLGFLLLGLTCLLACLCTHLKGANVNWTICIVSVLFIGLGIRICIKGDDTDNAKAMRC